MTDQVVDFDATLAEVEEGETFPFKFLGQEWQLPRSPIALGMLKVRRMNMRAAELQARQASGQITEADANKIIDLAGGADIDQMLAHMVGEELVAQWVASPLLTDEKLRRVFRWLWLKYNGQDPDQDYVGETAPPANREERRAVKARTSSRKSSRAGASSKPTGSGNTTKSSRTA